jgi:hypothetical protein
MNELDSLVNSEPQRQLENLYRTLNLVLIPFQLLEALRCIFSLLQFVEYRVDIQHPRQNFLETANDLLVIFDVVDRD